MALAAAWMVSAAACGDNLAPAGPDAGDDAAEVCVPPPGDQPFFDLDQPACRHLSSYRFFSDAPAQEPADGVMPYDVNSALFSDYATKHRFVWVPPGTAMRYRSSGPFDIPVGGLLIKSFGFRADLRDPQSAERLVETRFLVHGEMGWYGLVYLWNQDQTDARLQKAGGIVPVSWTHIDGSHRELSYIVPNVNQCVNCHTSGDAPQPIGMRARHVNRDYAYASGSENQLTAMTERGMLDGAPADPAQAPRAPVWDDPQSGTVEQRARAWLDINCAHCHSPNGPARTSGLDLRWEQDNPAMYGVCKTPVAAGAGAGGRHYGIVPGAPDDSILVFRIESVDPGVRMPELLRQTEQVDAVALIRQWISEMDGSCGPPS